MRDIDEETRILNNKCGEISKMTQKEGRKKKRKRYEKV